jgi:hypothetical protein
MDYSHLTMASWSGYLTGAASKASAVSRGQNHRADVCRTEFPDMAKLLDVTTAFLLKVYNRPPFLDIHYYVSYKNVWHL